MEYEIKHVRTETDLNRAFTFTESILSEYEGLYNPHHSKESWMEQMVEYSEFMLYAEIKGRIVGTVFGFVEGNNSITVSMVATDVKFRHHRIASSLLEELERRVLARGYRFLVLGAVELAEAVIEACNDKSDFKFLYPLEMKLRDRVELIAKEVYGADGVSWSPEATARAKAFESDPKYADYATMMVKTHLSLSHNPALKGVPKNWTLPIRDILIYSGAKFLCPLAGSISLMPGTGSNPGFRRVDVDTKTGDVEGLF